MGGPTGVSTNGGRAAYINSDQAFRGVLPREAVRKRRGQATIAILKTFEELIEPLIEPGNQETVDHFKNICRAKINGLAYEGLRAADAQPGENVTGLATDLAEQFLTDDPMEV